MTVEVPQRAGIGGPIKVPTPEAELFPAMYLCASDAGVRNPRVYVYSLAAYDGDDPDVDPLCTWNFSGIGGVNCIFHVRALPDGRLLLVGWTPSPANIGVVIEVPANAPLIDGTPPCRVVARGDVGGLAATIQGIGQTQFGEVVLCLNQVGPNGALKVAPEMVGHPTAVVAAGSLYDNGATTDDPLGGDDICADLSGNMWTSRYGGGTVAAWDLTVAPGTIAPSVLLNGSNWNGSLGVAFSESGELAAGNYDANRVNILTPPFASGNPAPSRTLASANAGDRGVNGLCFDARNGNLVVAYYDTGTLAIFSAAQFAAGGTQTPIRRFNIITAVGFPELAPSIGVRR